MSINNRNTKILYSVNYGKSFSKFGKSNIKMYSVQILYLFYHIFSMTIVYKHNHDRG